MEHVDVFAAITSYNSYSPTLAACFGGIDRAVVFRLYLDANAIDNEEWIHMADVECGDKTGLSLDQVKNARSWLLREGILEEHPSLTHDAFRLFRINGERFYGWVKEKR